MAVFFCHNSTICTYLYLKDTGENMHRTDDLRIREMKELVPPSHLIREFACSVKASETAAHARTALHNILHGKDDRLMVVIGPCSIHDTKAAMEYARRLAEQRTRFAGELEIVMRVYFEKPRTTVGWKGLINDPYMDNSFRINDGLRIARELLLNINELGLPAGTEFLDVISPQYIADLISWGPSAPAPQNRRFTASWHPACLARSVLRMAPTAMSKLRSMRSRHLRSRIIFYQ
jgi:phospho-2-dehydro-3-deoxyheptonate aldolase